MSCRSAAFSAVQAFSVKSIHDKLTSLLHRQPTALLSSDTARVLNADRIIRYLNYCFDGLQDKCHNLISNSPFNRLFELGVFDLVTKSIGDCDTNECPNYGILYLGNHTQAAAYFDYIYRFGTDTSKLCRNSTLSSLTVAQNFNGDDCQSGSAWTQMLSVCVTYLHDMSDSCSVISDDDNTDDPIPIDNNSDYYLIILGICLAINVILNIYEESIQKSQNKVSNQDVPPERLNSLDSSQVKNQFETQAKAFQTSQQIEESHVSPNATSVSLAGSPRPSHEITNLRF